MLLVVLIRNAVKSEKCDSNIENFPAVTYPDIVNYLIFRSSPFTANKLKSYKSLEAYNQVIEGRVQNLKVYLYEDKRLLIEKLVTFIRIHSYFFFSNVKYAKARRRIESLAK